MENTMMSNSLRRLLIIFGALLVVSLLVSAFSAVYVTLAAPQRSTYVPTTIGFEGQLADAQGTPVADGSYSISFNLYNAATGGSPVWSETQPSVQVKDGLYSVQLGSITEFEADDFSGPRWLGVKVGSDAEMAPRISVGAVPFALNARYAQGLQNNPVADTAPETDDALMWTGSQWAPQGMTFPDLAPVDSNASPNDLLKNYRSGAALRWKANDTVEVAGGELMINGYMRRNTSAVDVKFVADTGGNGPNRGLASSPTPNTTYYIYAVADDLESTFDLLISENATTPTGVTNYRKLGSFKTVSDSTNIIKGSAANVVDVPVAYPRRAFGFHLNDTVVTGSPLTYYDIGGYIAFGHAAMQSPAANGDTFTSSFLLKEGTYTLHVIGTQFVHMGKIDWYIDDVRQISGQDWYGSGAHNTYKTGSITVAGDGYHVLKGVVNGKNVGSDGYMISLTEWWIAPTSD